MLRLPWILGVLLCSLATGQTQNTTTAAVTTPVNTSPEAAITQIRESVAFIRLTCAKRDKLYESRGTGFFVAYPDNRFVGDSSQFFVYLVTNRHVALCWDDDGHPMQVTSVAVSMNLRSPVDGKFVTEVTLNPSGNIDWVLPTDEAVDLATFPSCQISTRQMPNFYRLRCLPPKMSQNSITFTRGNLCFLVVSSLSSQAQSEWN